MEVAKMGIGLTLEGLVDYIIEEIHKIKLNPSAIAEDEYHRFVSDDEKTIWNNKADTSTALPGKDGLMSATDKLKLDGIEAGANKLPPTLPSAMIVPDSEHRFTNDTQIEYWNKKAECTVANKYENGLMSIDDKLKLDGIEAEANKYIHPLTHSADMIVENTAHQFITEAERNKLLGIEPLANNYIHPTSHPANIIIQDENNRFMTDAERTKLENLSNYIHPESHPASMITEDSTHRFVSDLDKSNWTDKYNKTEIDNKVTTITNQISALNTGIDWKESVNSYTDILTTYPVPVDGWTVNVKDTDTTYRYTGAKWISISANSMPLATTTLDGKMSASDKDKLDNIEANANHYIHPDNHNAVMIIQDNDNRFVTTDQMNYWNAKSDPNHTHPTASITDNRSIVSSVGDYSRQVGFDFKSIDKIGSPDTSTYAGVVTIAPWTDDSGGGNHQLAFTSNGNFYYRYGTRSGGWNSWRKVIDSNDKPYVISATAPSDKNKLWIDSNGLAYFHNGTSWVSIKGSYMA
jgi:hypothetical protein